MGKRSRATGKFPKAITSSVGFFCLVVGPPTGGNHEGLKVTHRKDKMKSAILGVGIESQVTGYRNVVPFAEAPNTVGTISEGALKAPG